jgi:hypothetical protein
VLMEEVQDHLITSLVLLLDFFLLKVATCSHPTVDLVGEPLDHVLHLHTLLPLLNVLLGLVSRWEHDVGDGNSRRIVSGHHGGVARRRDLELAVLHRRQVYNLGTSQYDSTAHHVQAHLSAPAEANDGPLLNAIALAQLIHNLGNAWQGLGWSSLGLEELAKLLLLVLVVRGVPRNVGRTALKEIGHKDLVLLVFVGVR